MTGNTRKVSLKSKTDDRAEQVSERPKRTPLRESYRNILTVENKDPNYEYRWVLDQYARHDDQSNEFHPGQRLARFIAAHWQFVHNHEVTVGDAYVYKTGNVGSIVRVPAGHGDYHYLMKISKELYDEDQKEKQGKIDVVEKSMTSPNVELGQYGSGSIDFDVDR